MSVTVTLPAPPEPYLETTLLPATRRRVMAIGSGLGGLTATKALKHDLANIFDAIVFLTRVFLTRVTAQATLHVVNQPSLCLHIVPTTAAVVGTLITLYVAIYPRRQGISMASDLCGIRHPLGKVGAHHAVHRNA